MFVLNNDDLSIYATRGDIVFFTVSAEDNGEPYTFRAGDVVRVKIFGKKDAQSVVLEKDFPITEDSENVEILLTAEDTKIGGVISKPRDYWYEIELNPLTKPQTIIGYDENGPKVFKLFPEGADIPAFVPSAEDIPFIDSELDLTSPRPVENQAVAREIVQLKAAFAKTDNKSNDTAEALSVERARIDNIVSQNAVKVSKTLDYTEEVAEDTKSVLDATITSDGVHATIQINFREAEVFYSSLNMFIIPDECRPIETGVIHTEGRVSYGIYYNTTGKYYYLEAVITDEEYYTPAPSEAGVVNITYALDNYELKDIRVGADGTVYRSAGEAVRIQNVPTMEIHSTTMQPVIGEAVGAFSTFNGYMQVGSKNVAVKSDAECGTTVYVYRVSRGIRYMIGYEKLCAFAPDYAENGSLTNSVEVGGDFIAPEDGYLYTYQTLAPTLCIVDGYVMLSGTQFDNPAKVTVAHEKQNGFSLIRRRDSLFGDISAGGDGCYCGKLGVGYYVAMGATYLVSQQFSTESVNHIIKTVDAGAAFEIATETEYVSQVAPPIMLVETNITNEQTALLLEDVTEQHHNFGEEVYGVESDFFGVFNGAGGRANAPSGSRYNFKIFPVVKGKTYQISCDAYSYPGSGYPLYGFFFVDDIGGGYAPFGLLSQKKTVSGSIQHTFVAPISGYMWVSHDSANPSELRLCIVNSTNYRISIPTVTTYSKLLTVGDSLSGNKNLWQPKFIEIMGIPEYTNAGGSGGTIASGENSIYNRVYALEGGDGVDLITLWGGFNDFNSSVELSTLEEQKNGETRDTATFYGGLMACVEKLLTLYPTARLVLIGTTPFYWYSGDKDWHTRTINGKKITDFVDAVKNVAEYYSLPFVDLLRTSGFNKFNYSIYFMDQGYYLHPNNVGNEKIAHIIAGAIKAL